MSCSSKETGAYMRLGFPKKNIGLGRTPILIHENRTYLYMHHEKNHQHYRKKKHESKHIIDMGITTVDRKERFRLTSLLK
jgi:hypothetical protein